MNLRLSDQNNNKGIEGELGTYLPKGPTQKCISTGSNALTTIARDCAMNTTCDSFIYTLRF
jgi:hypothetical protein